MRPLVARAALSRSQDPRLQLPVGGSVDRMWVGAVGLGWIELVDTPDEQVLTRVPAVADQRRRLSLPRGGVKERFGHSKDGQLLTVSLLDLDGKTWLLGCDFGLLAPVMSGATWTRPLVLSAPGWVFPWGQFRDALDSTLLARELHSGGAA